MEGASAGSLRGRGAGREVVVVDEELLDEEAVDEAVVVNGVVVDEEEKEDERVVEGFD